MLAGAAYLRRVAPSLRVRIINVIDLIILGLEGSHPHSLNHGGFEELFTADRSIYFNYSGYTNKL